MAQYHQFEYAEMSTGKDKKKPFTNIDTQKKDILAILGRYIKAANAYGTDKSVKKKMDADKKQYKLFLKGKKNTVIYDLFKTWASDKKITSMTIEQVLQVFLELKSRVTKNNECSGKFSGDCIKLGREIKGFIKMIK
jgi:hypothetical protein